MLKVENYHQLNSILISKEDDFHISIIKDAKTGKVYVIVYEEPDFWGRGGKTHRFVVGRKTIEKLPGIEKVLARKYKVPKEVRGE